MRPSAASPARPARRTRPRQPYGAAADRDRHRHFEASPRVCLLSLRGLYWVTVFPGLMILASLSLLDMLNIYSVPFLAPPKPVVIQGQGHAPTFSHGGNNPYGEQHNLNPYDDHHYNNYDGGESSPWLDMNMNEDYDGEGSVYDYQPPKRYQPPEVRPSPLETKISSIRQELQKAAVQHKPNHKPMDHQIAQSENKTTVFHKHLLPAPHGADNHTMAIFVLSAQHHFDRRQAIRETWAANSTNVYFVIGHSNCKERQNENVTNVDKNHQNCEDEEHAFLLQEQLRFHDLLEIPFQEYYRGLPEKLVQVYHYVTHKLPQIQWIVKVDDDTFVRPHSLQNYLELYNPQLPLVLGEIVEQSQVAREGKWEEQDYTPMYYPWWPRGSCGHIVSLPIAQFVSQQSPKLHRYQGEDVSLGIWLHEGQRDHAFLKDRLRYIHAPSLFSSERSVEACYDAGSFLIIGHDLDVNMMQACNEQHLAAEENDPNKKYPLTYLGGNAGYSKPMTDNHDDLIRNHMDTIS